MEHPAWPAARPQPGPRSQSVMRASPAVPFRKCQNPRGKCLPTDCRNGPERPASPCNAAVTTSGRRCDIAGPDRPQRSSRGGMWSSRDRRGTGRPRCGRAGLARSPPGHRNLLALRIGGQLGLASAGVGVFAAAIGPPYWRTGCNGHRPAAPRTLPPGAGAPTRASAWCVGLPTRRMHNALSIPRRPPRRPNG